MTTQSFVGDPNNPPFAIADGTKEYQVQNMSNWSTFGFILGAPLSMLLAIGVAIAAGGGAIAFIIGIAVAVGLMVFLYRYLQEKILVAVGEGSIRVHYLRSPFFVTADDMNLTPGDIASYKSDNFNGARFALYMKDGRKFRAAVGNIGDTDAIARMSEHIIAMINDKRYSAAVAGAPPRRRKTYAEGTTGLVLAIAAIGVMIAIGIGIIFYPENHNSSDTVRGIGIMFSCLAFVFYVFSLRRKARKEREEGDL